MGVLSWSQARCERCVALQALLFCLMSTPVYPAGSARHMQFCRAWPWVVCVLRVLSRRAGCYRLSCLHAVCCVLAVFGCARPGQRMPLLL